MPRFSFLCLPLVVAGCAVAAKTPLPEDLGIDVETDTAADGMGPFQGGLEVCGGTSREELTERNNIHFYRFASEGCSDAEFTLRTLSGADMLLVLFEPFEGEWLELERNDDCRGSLTESCIRRGLSVGDYVLGVSTYGRFAGEEVDTDYELVVSCLDDFTCGDSSCNDDEECGAGRFCAYGRSASCGAGGTGRCQVYPDACSPEFAEVCGCDGNTYANACAAESRGVSVASDAACGATGEGVEGDSCEGGEFPGCRPGLRCDFSRVSSCEVAAPGVCSRDEGVFCPDDYVPVCGCDGRTYGNSCLRRAAGVAEDHDGEC